MPCPPSTELWCASPPVPGLFSHLEQESWAEELPLIFAGTVLALRRRALPISPRPPSWALDNHPINHLWNEGMNGLIRQVLRRTRRVDR